MRRALIGLAVLVPMVIGIAWLTHSALQADTDGAAPSSSARPKIGDVRNWGFLLSNLDVAAAVRSRHDLIVIDDEPHGPRQPEQVAQAVKALQQKADGGRRLVLAHLAIGEVGDDRAFWQRDWVVAKPAGAVANDQRLSAPGSADDAAPRLRMASPIAPAWLADENPNWPGSYRVHYWQRQWQSLVYGDAGAMLDRIIEAGFDGVFLDRADTFKLWTRNRPTAEADMVAFITALSDYARSRQPDFVIVMQNAEELLANPQLREVLDAVAKEDLLFGGRGIETPNEARVVRASTHYLRMFRAEGRPVVAIEYLSRSEDIDRARRQIEELGFMALVGPRGQDRMDVAGP